MSAMLLSSRRNVEPWQPPCCSCLDLRLFTYVEAIRALVLVVHLLMDHNTAIDDITILVCVDNTDWGLVLEVRPRIYLPFRLFGAYPVDRVFIVRNFTGVTVIRVPSDLRPLSLFVKVVEAVRVSTGAGVEASNDSLSLGFVDIDFKAFGAGIGCAGDCVLWDPDKVSDLS